MRYISIFSGIEAASVAFGPLGWEPVAFAEIEPFPCAVLAHRFPDVPNLGDVREIDWKGVVAEHGPVDLVCGGSPCQSFSIAGDRTGLDGASRLMFEYIRAVRDVRPRWFLWENVPGVFSTDKGRAFGILLDEMEELGYGLAWRTLDAQFFGVAQRRRRVFLVGCLGDGACAAAVLFDRESVSGNTCSGKQKREELAAGADRRVGGSYTLKLRHTGSSNGGRGGEGPLIQDDVSATLATKQDQTLFAPVLDAFRTGTVCMATGQANAEVTEDGLSPVLTCAHEQPIVCVVKARYAVRRLTPVECERLQGFPDGWTDVPYKGKDHPPNTSRYKALGNAWAVPCAAWIGKRIGYVDEIGSDGPCACA